MKFFLSRCWARLAGLWKRPGPRPTTFVADGVSVPAAAAAAGLAKFTTKIDEDGDSEVVNASYEVGCWADEPEEDPRRWLASGFLWEWMEAWKAQDYFQMSRVQDKAEGVLIELIYGVIGEGHVEAEEGGPP